ncbi:Glutamate--tRNA ligase [Usitatibacter rugosus]|uniref:Glutamate--tRNA ligase n=1 Tax=Usitatibacter rugosus TaxID=2732067 RepID=A0A6M4GU26_9PROT|nr:glutamate--tRNA ligase [Usitatibacter rugosus]QJR10636.1 Glutamate--tRNA ligase [Usitatibacter rugosus]
MTVRTRFAPSPTGYLHLGGARTALYNWAYARRHGGVFLLRIEDTDLERSTQASVQAIFDAMEWLGLDYDEGPFYQMQRLSRYREIAEQLLRDGKAYYAYETKEELDAMREAQSARGEKPRYDRRWRESKETPPAGRPGVLRLKNPISGDVTWDDVVKGPISISNDELDDLVLIRADGVPTYNFGVVIDDVDMAMTHVIRGDDHVNNTPRQINVYRAMGADIPKFGHVPMILGSDGQRLSKRHGAVNVMQYRDDGFLGDAMVNYLARLGWSHGDDEVFSREQLVEWFDFAHVSRSPARWDPEKLTWMNGEYLKRVPDAELAANLERAKPEVYKFVASVMDPVKMTAAGRAKFQLVTDQERFLMAMAEPAHPDAAAAEHLGEAGKGVLKEVLTRLSALPEWTAPAIGAALKETVGALKVKMPQVMMPFRAALTGVTQTPAIDAIAGALHKEVVIARLQKAVA